MSYDSILVFSKTWGAIYLLLFFLATLVWTYWPSRKKEYDEAAKNILEEEDKPWR